jgi:hypothetical protein
MASEFDSLMAGMGIKRMGNEKSKPATKVVRRRAGQASVIVGDAPSSKQKTEGAEARLAKLEAGLDLVKGERAEAEAKVSSLKSKVKKLKASLAEAEAANSGPQVTVAAVLAEWGFESAEERSALLMLDGMLERIISNPDLGADEALRSELVEGVVRVCRDCSGPKGKLVITVSPPACSTCGGHDINREARRFVDAALINGRLRIVIVGRDTHHHRWVRERVGDKRLVLTHVSAGVRRDVAAVQADVDHADAVIIWDPETIDPAHLAIYQSASRVGEVSSSSMGGFLAAAAAIIATD